MSQLSAYIVDDHLLAVYDLEQKVLRSQIEIKIIGKNTSSEKAYEEIIKLRPDVVFTDIKMPGFTGLELIEQIKSQHMDTLFIAISAFQDFDFVKRALQLGASDYVLKPVVQSDIDELLVRVSEEIVNKQNDKLSKHIAEAISGIQIEDEGLTCFLSMVIVGSYQTLESNELLRYEKELVLGSIFSELEKKISDENTWVIPGDNYNELYIVQLTQNNIHTNICDFFSEKSFPAHVVFNPNGIKLTTLYLKKNELKVFSKKNIIFGHPSIHMLSSSEEKQFTIPKYINQLKVENNLTNLLQYGNKNKVSQDDLRQMLIVFFSILKKNGFLITMNDEKVRDEVTMSIAKSNSYEQLENQLKEMIKNENKRQNETESKELMIKKAKQYLDTHLNQSISISEVAEKLYLSPTYFNRVFKEAVGIPPGEYFVNKKIEQAIYLLVNTSLPIKSIAYQCGYKDALYFSKVFKQKVGRTPSEYRILK